MKLSETFSSSNFCIDEVLQTVKEKLKEQKKSKKSEKPKKKKK
jgi:hypothetical protein